MVQEEIEAVDQRGLADTLTVSASICLKSPNRAPCGALTAEQVVAMCKDFPAVHHQNGTEMCHVSSVQ